MKDYSLNEEEKGSFIVGVRCNSEKNTCTVYFADGTKFKNIAFSADNLKKIENIQEDQADRGIENLQKFKARKTKEGIMTMISGIGTATIVSCFSVSPVLDKITSEHPVIAIAGIGVISIIGAIPAFTKFRKNKGIVEELEKISFRNAHRKELDSFRDYPNALTGVSYSTASNLLAVADSSDDSDPFSIFNIDDFTEEDLRRMVINIEKEKEFDFQYSKKYTK